jgi:hypothetical protein
MSHFSLKSLISSPNNNNTNNNLKSTPPFSIENTIKKPIIKLKSNEIPTTLDTTSTLRRYYFAYSNPRQLGIYLFIYYLPMYTSK